jgi:glycerate-2-kinase
MAALEMSRLPGWTFLALATDGVDGNGGAGAWIRAGEIPTEGQILNAVRRGDTATLWESNGTGLPRNATGNNLRDLYVLTMEK